MEASSLEAFTANSPSGCEWKETSRGRREAMERAAARFTRRPFLDILQSLKPINELKTSSRLQCTQESGDRLTIDRLAGNQRAGG